MNGTNRWANDCGGTGCLRGLQSLTMEDELPDHGENTPLYDRPDHEPLPVNQVMKMSLGAERRSSG